MAALLDACNSGNVVEARKLLSSTLFDPKSLEAKDEATGMTPLHAAVSQGPLELVQVLLNAKSNVDAKNISSETPLHLIVKSGPLTMKAVMMIETLVKSGKADVAVTDSDGKTLFDILSLSVNEGKAGSLAQDVLPLLNLRTVETPATQPQTGERTESVRKLLEVHIPDLSKPVPYRELSPRTPPVSPKRIFLPEEAVNPPLPVNSGIIQENARLVADYAALREELFRIRDQLSRIDPKHQLKRLYTRLIQLESIETALRDFV